VFINIHKKKDYSTCGKTTITDREFDGVEILPNNLSHNTPKGGRKNQ
jgi:hypothetical protein